MYLKVNGMDAFTGKNLITPVQSSVLAKSIQDASVRKRKFYLKDYFGNAGKSFVESSLENADRRLDDISLAGWGLLVNKKEKKVADSLAALVRHRNGRIIFYDGADPELWIEKNCGWDFESDKLPYYILIAGAPGDIPFNLQYLLDIQHSVGRIHFKQESHYEDYARKIIEYEKSSMVSENNSVFWAPDAGGEDPTVYSRKFLAEPLIENIKRIGCDVLPILGSRATEANLIKQFENGEYSLLFTASHGLGYPRRDEKKEYLQGALVCQDFEFNPDLMKKNRGLITGMDITENTCIRSKIFFAFACFSAGSSANSDFAFWLPEPYKSDLKKYEPSKDFVAYLPQELLRHKDGPLVFIAHIDPAWVFSFIEPEQNDRRIEPFKNSLKRILQGVPVGHSMRDFNQRYASLSVALLNYVIDHLERGEKINPYSLSNIWISRNDAQNYIILGDPAVRLKVARDARKS